MLNPNLTPAKPESGWSVPTTMKVCIDPARKLRPISKIRKWCAPPAIPSTPVPAEAKSPPNSAFRISADDSTCS
jgi:hypothetical protein